MRIKTLMVLTGMLMLWAVPAQADPPNVVYWQINTDIDYLPTSANDDIWAPAQTFHSYGTTSSLNTSEPVVALECGTYYQVDKYTGNHPFGPGSTLSGSHEDSQWIHSWKFVYGGDCVEPEPEVVEGDELTALGECVGDQWVVTTTVTHWTETDGVRVYDEPVVRTTSEHDPTCVTAPDKPSPEPETQTAKPAAPVVADPTFTG